MKIRRAKNKLKSDPVKQLDISLWQIEHIKKSIVQADNGIFAKEFDIQKFFVKNKIIK